MPSKHLGLVCIPTKYDRLHCVANEALDPWLFSKRPAKIAINGAESVGRLCLKVPFSTLRLYRFEALLGG